MNRNETHVCERIANDLKDHVITLRHEAGMYRHWRCQKPGTWNMGFDIVTWPGSLCFTGDMGDYLFQRTEDMVAFMAGACKSYSYAAEKCVAHDGRLKEWCEERFKEALAERIKDAEEDGGKFWIYRGGRRIELSVTEAIAEIQDAYSNYESKDDAMKAMYESGLWDELPNCEVYSFHFLWCLHAIKWFCEKLEAASTLASSQT